MWTQFWDMYGGGSLKVEPYHDIYIEAPEEEAKVIFYNRFNHNPEQISCACCGKDYSISSGEPLAQLTGFHRGCRYLKTPKDRNGRYKPITDPEFLAHYYLEEGEEPPKGYTALPSQFRKKYQTLEQYSKREDVLIIYADEISDEERIGELP